MSNQITTAFVNEFKTGVDLTVQQKTALLRSAVRVEPMVKDRAFFDQIGAVASTIENTRHADTTYVNTPHKRRSVSTQRWSVADLVDEQDKVRTLNDPTNAYTQAFTAALSRSHDRIAIEAMLGTSYTGQTGTTAVPLPAGQKIANGATGFTLAKVRQAMRILKSKNAINPGDELYIAWTSYQEDQFIDTTEVKSVDYNTQRVLLSGNVDGFYGFKFIRIEDANDGVILPKAATIRSCVAWVKSGVVLGINKDIQARIDVLPGKNYSTQVYAAMDIGATRMHEEKVVQIDVVEN